MLALGRPVAECRTGAVYNDSTADRQDSPAGGRGLTAPMMNQCLIFDADDTLWDNNVYFERAIAEFLELLGPRVSDRGRVRSLLSTLIETEIIPQRGYGTRHFTFALAETCRRACGEKDGAGILRAIERIGDRLVNHPVPPLPGVASTLEVLRSHHRLMLFTKGDPEEQFGKLRRSGLRDYFDLAEVVEEKDTLAYQELISRHRLRQDATFMIGNSPRSDVLPALAAGLWAIFIPHPHTWEMEDHEVRPHPRLLCADSIRQVPSLVSGLTRPSDHTTL